MENPHKHIKKNVCMFLVNHRFFYGTKLPHFGITLIYDQNFVYKIFDA